MGRILELLRVDCQRPGIRDDVNLVGEGAGRTNNQISIWRWHGILHDLAGVFGHLARYLIIWQLL